MRSLAILVALAALAVPVRPARAQTRTVILVRHAEKALEPARDPALTPEGRARADALAAALADAHVGSVVLTPTLRTRQTASPTIRATLAEPVEVGFEGGLAAHVQAVAAAVRGRPAGETVLVVGHSNTIPAIIGALGGPSLADLDDGAYGDLFILTIPQAGVPSLIHAHVGAPSG